METTLTQLLGIGRLTFFVLLIIAALSAAAAHPTEQRATTAVLSFGTSSIGQQASQTLAASLPADGELVVVDSDQARTAARGAGYLPTLNMHVLEARTLGSVIGSDFYILGDAQTLRRSPSSGTVYFEAYTSIFLISSRSGRLVTWQRLSFQSSTPAAAENLLLSALQKQELRKTLITAIRVAQNHERTARESAIEKGILVLEEAPADDKTAEAEGLRLPRPYRRFQPIYPASAAQAEVEAIVDVLVDLDATGEVTNAEIARWAGFGLDEAALATVRKLHFFPAMRNGVAIPLRVLLRYNFRKPPK